MLLMGIFIHACLWTTYMAKVQLCLVIPASVSGILCLAMPTDDDDHEEQRRRQTPRLDAGHIGMRVVIIIYSLNQRAAERRRQPGRS